MDTMTEAYNDGYIAAFYHGKPDTDHPKGLTENQLAFWFDGYDRGKEDLERDRRAHLATTI